MAPRSKKNSTSSLDALSNALILTFEPLVAALDFTFDDFATLQEQNENLDTGNETPSMRDNGLRFLIGGMCQSVWRQAYGVIRSKDGKSTYMNANQMLARSKTYKEAIDAKTAETIQTEDLDALRWYRINEERLIVLNSLLDAYKTVYLHFFREEWKPTEAPADIESKKKARNLTPEEKARIFAMLKVAGDKNEART